MDDEVRRLLDKQAIYEVLLRYCRGVDRGDLDLIKASYHPDATDHHGLFQATGNEEIARSIIEMTRRDSKACQHILTNVLIDLEGDVADVESYFIGLLTFEKESRLYLRTLNGRYIDRFQLRTRWWRISERTLVHDWSQVEPMGAPWPPGVDFAQGLRSREDPVYIRRFPAHRGQNTDASLFDTGDTAPE